MILESRVAVVTGAGRGIGRAIALALAREGARVLCVSRTAGNAEAVAGEISEANGVAAAIGADISQLAEVEAAFHTALEIWGRVDILVNNAGVTRDNLLLRMKEEDWDEVLDTNLKGAYLCTKFAAKSMIKQRSGRIVNITSVVGIAGNAGQANYAASKAGLIGFTRSVAKELGSRSITCNAVAPGFIETDMTAELSQEARSQIEKNCTLGRLGIPDDVANAVLFLCSDAAGYITGQVLSVDGGLAI